MTTNADLSYLVDFVRECRTKKLEPIDFDYFDVELLWQLVTKYVDNL